MVQTDEKTQKTNNNFNRNSSDYCRDIYFENNQWYKVSSDIEILGNYALGGTIENNTQAQIDSDAKLLEFLEENHN